MSNRLSEPRPRAPSRPPLPWRIAGGAVIGLTGAATVIVVALCLGGRAYTTRAMTSISVTDCVGEDEVSRTRSLSHRLSALRPRGVYVVVDTARNRLRVLGGDAVRREAPCSTGTGTMLRDPRDGRTWVFDTPIGERRVLDKRRDPVWTKPDWAFIEEGMLPTWDPEHRYDDVSLGDYALDLGDGYLIHGTLFQTLLGQPVTHGCIRLGDEDLEYVFTAVPFNAPVYLY